MSRFLKLLEALQGYSHFPCLEGVEFAYAYGDLLAEVERWQDWLDAWGAQSGSVVGIRADYSLSAVAALLALCRRGSIPALIPGDRPVERYLQDAQASALLEIAVDSTHHFQAGPGGSHPLLARLQRSGEAGFILFTSGSTGRPKAALHSLECFLHKFDRPGRPLRTLAFLLFDHVAGMDTLFYTLWHGGTLIFTYRRDPRSVLDLIESQRVEVLPTSPSFLRFLCALPNDRQRDLSSLKIITYGSEPMDASTLQRLNERFPNTRIVQKYGTTETGSPRTESRGPDSLWVRFKDPGLETRIIDGVLWMRGRGTMLGYLNSPSPIAEDGWYCTGDQVQVEGEWIRFLGRSDEVIKVGAEKVIPTDIESTIRDLEFVRNVIVSGQPHTLLGQVVIAHVSLKTASTDTRAAITAIRKHCQARLPPHAVPVRIDIGDTPSPLTPRQKAGRTMVTIRKQTRGTVP